MFTIHSLSITGAPTIVKTDIMIRSMGPISEVDMVSSNYTVTISSVYCLYCICEILASFLQLRRLPYTPPQKQAQPCKITTKKAKAINEP